LSTRSSASRTIPYATIISMRTLKEINASPTATSFVAAA
jgi:hypothetical protein